VNTISAAGDLPRMEPIVLESTLNQQGRTRPNTPVATDAAVRFDQAKHHDQRGEHWSARELMPLLGYRSWQLYKDALDCAAASCAIADRDAAAEFTPVTRGARLDFRLTRYAAWLVAMNGDARLPSTAAALNYFADKVIEAEIVEDLDEIEVARKYLAALEAKRDLLGKVADLAPAAASWQVLASSQGDFSVADAAKVLSRDPAIQLGQNRLFSTLANFSWAYRQQGDHAWRSYQSAIEAGWLAELPQSHSHPRTGRRVLDPPQLRVTAKGLAELRRRLGGGKHKTITELDGAATAAPSAQAVEARR